MKALKKAKIQVVAISYDDAKVLEGFGKKNKIEYPLLSDPKSKTIDAYKTRNKRVRRKNQEGCLLYTSPSPRDKRQSRMPSSA